MTIFRILLLLVPTLVCGQIPFHLPPDTTSTSDSLFVRASSTHFYDFISKQFVMNYVLWGDNILLFEVEDLIARKPEYTQVLTIHKSSRNGHLIIYYHSNPLFIYTVKEGIVDGVGHCFFPFKRTLAGVFRVKNSHLDGCFFAFNESGQVAWSAVFKKNRFIRYTFHDRYQSKLALARLNKVSVHPFSNIVHVR